MAIHAHTEYTYRCDMCQKISNKAPPDILNIFKYQCLDSSIKLNLKIDFSYGGYQTQSFAMTVLLST